MPAGSRPPPPRVTSSGYATSKAGTFTVPPQNDGGVRGGGDFPPVHARRRARVRHLPAPASPRSWRTASISSITPYLPGGGTDDSPPDVSSGNSPPGRFRTTWIKSTTSPSPAEAQRLHARAAVIVSIITGTSTSEDDAARADASARLPRAGVEDLVDRRRRRLRRPARRHQHLHRHVRPVAAGREVTATVAAAVGHQQGVPRRSRLDIIGAPRTSRSTWTARRTGRPSSARHSRAPIWPALAVPVPVAWSAVAVDSLTAAYSGPYGVSTSASGGCVLHHPPRAAPARRPLVRRGADHHDTGPAGRDRLRRTGPNISDAGQAGERGRPPTARLGSEVQSAPRLRASRNRATPVSGRPDRRRPRSRQRSASVVRRLRLRRLATTRRSRRGRAQPRRRWLLFMLQHLYLSDQERRAHSPAAARSAP